MLLTVTMSGGGSVIAKDERGAVLFTVSAPSGCETATSMIRAELPGLRKNIPCEHPAGSREAMIHVARILRFWADRHLALNLSVTIVDATRDEEVLVELT